MIPIRDENPTVRKPYVTLALIALNIVIFFAWQPRGFLTGSGSTDSGEVEVFLYEQALVPCEAVEGHPVSIPELEADDCDAADTPPPEELDPDKHVRLAAIVSMFLHAGLLHIGGNMLFLWIFGNNVEDRLGSLVFLAFYLAGGIAATIGHILTDPGSLTPVIGASGAVAAVMGAYLVWYPKAKVTTLFFFFLITWFKIPAWIFLGVWFVMQFLTNPDSGVAWVAHVVGFAFGALIALPLRGRGPTGPVPPPTRDPWAPYRFPR